MWRFLPCREKASGLEPRPSLYQGNGSSPSQARMFMPTGQVKGGDESIDG